MIVKNENRALQSIKDAPGSAMAIRHAAGAEALRTLLSDMTHIFNRVIPNAKIDPEAMKNLPDEEPIEV